MMKNPAVKIVIDLQINAKKIPSKSSASKDPKQGTSTMWKHIEDNSVNGNNEGKSFKS